MSRFRAGFVGDTSALFAVLWSVPDLLAAEVTGRGGQWNGCSSVGCFVFPHRETLPLLEAELNFLPLDSSQHFLDKLNPGDVTHTESSTSVHHCICFAV